MSQVLIQLCDVLAFYKISKQTLPYFINLTVKNIETFFLDILQIFQVY